MLVSLQLLTVVLYATLAIASPGAKPSKQYRRSGPEPSPVYGRAFDKPGPSAVYGRAEKPGPSVVYGRADKPGPSPVHHKRDGAKPGPSPVHHKRDGAKPGPSPVHQKRDGAKPGPSPVHQQRDGAKPSPVYNWVENHPSPVYGRANAEPKPSSVYYDYDKRAVAPEPSGEYQEKRFVNEQILVQTLCPDGLTACPVDAMTFVPDTLHDWDQISYDCVEVDNDLTSCGGCSSFDEKHDCTLISQARSVSCSAGKCKVHTCALGYQPSTTGSGCVRA